jgi:hypothetical protein
MAQIRVGKPDVKQDAPTHIKGIHQGNQGPYAKQPGHNPDGTADSRRSTGISPKKRDPVLGKLMPNLPPG